MKKIALTFIACWAALQLNAAEPQWLTDFPAAQAKAKTEKKLLLMDFTGSDWCPPCKALKRDIFSSPEFEAFAKTNLVLVEVDFPRRKELEKSQAEANDKLQSKFNIEGFPTVIVFDANGKQLSRETGYGGANAKDYVAKLQKLKGK